MLKTFISVIVYSIIFLNTAHSFNGIKDLESTRLKSLGGAGVASILLNEATILNPSTIVFLQKSSIYYQKDTDELDEEDKNRTGKFKEAYSESIVITDTSAALKGGLSYHYQNEDAGKRKRIAASVATHMGKRSSFGLALRHNDEDSRIIDKTYTQFVLGYTHIPMEGLNLGFTIIDPTQTVDEYFKFIGGIQYTLHDKIDLLLDLGAGDVENSDKEAFSKMAIQLKSFKRLFLRYGRFHDKLYNEKGAAVGFSWVGPRFSFDFSQKTFEPITDSTDNFSTDEQIVETSFGLTVLL